MKVRASVKKSAVTAKLSNVTVSFALFAVSLSTSSAKAN